MNTIYNTVSNRLNLPVDLIQSDETVQQLISIMQKAGRSQNTIIGALVMYLSALRENIRRDK